MIPGQRWAGKGQMPAREGWEALAGTQTGCRDGEQECR